ncbi:hypothetical protein I3760_13G129300 [Carya illinoinensis]|nr:hypothetical protein I3760_13G129300 [Carya illinoinensis]
MSLCMWKTRFNCLPIEERVQSVGVSLASRCACCSRGGVEDQNHFLCNGTMAFEVWRRVACLLSILCMAFKDWWSRCRVWFRCAKKSTQHGVLIKIMPTLISWRLWK